MDRALWPPSCPIPRPVNDIPCRAAPAQTFKKTKDKHLQVPNNLKGTRALGDKRHRTGKGAQSSVALRQLLSPRHSHEGSCGPDGVKNFLTCGRGAYLIYLLEGLSLSATLMITYSAAPPYPHRLHKTTAQSQAPVSRSSRSFRPREVTGLLSHLHQPFPRLRKKTGKIVKTKTVKSCKRRKKKKTVTNC